MSTSGPPGRRPRTIVVPNPGGRRPGGTDPGVASPYPQPQVPPTPSASPGAPSPYGNPWDMGGAPQPVPQAAPQQQPAYQPPPTQPDYRTEGPSEPGEAPVAAGLLLHSRAALNENALLRAAQPLLLMLARLRAGLVQARSSSIMEDVAQFIQDFEYEARSAGYNEDQVQTSKYALCATADDVIQNIPVDDRQRWTQYSMLSRFFSERIGGVRFFEELKRMRADPAVNLAVLELMSACMAAGFEGVYRASPGGLANLERVQRDVYDAIRRVKPRETNDLSPRWQGLTIDLNAKRNRVPLWAIAVAVVALLCGTFLALRTLLVFEAAEVADELLALHPLTPVTIIRDAYVPTVATPVEPEEPPAPPPPTPQSISVRDELAAEIQSGQVIYDDSGADIRITIGDIIGMVLFRSGSDVITQEFVPVVRNIGQALEETPGPITVIGHTDSIPIRSVRFPSNYELSVSRAEAVARMLGKELSDPSRITPMGKGADVPIGDNGTAEGRARNRRVDIIVPKEG